MQSINWVCVGPAALVANSEKAFARYESDYDIIIDNIVCRGEFAHVNKLYGQQIYQVVLRGLTAQSVAMTQRNAQNFMSSYDPSSTASSTSDDWANKWSDFIYDRNSYTTTDGHDFKASTQYNSVYQSGNQIYMGPVGSAPDGWTRLMPK